MENSISPASTSLPHNATKWRQLSDSCLPSWHHTPLTTPLTNLRSEHLRGSRTYASSSVEETEAFFAPHEYWTIDSLFP
jgi:hypothetical protein